MDKNLWRTIGDFFKHDDVAGALVFLEKSLKKQPTKQFKRLLDAKFSNPPSVILTNINAFIEQCQQHFDVQAVYLEMNGFDINYDRWYFDFFAYSELGDDEDDRDWLCEWNSDRWPDMTLEGLESVQKDFETYDKKRLWENA